MTTTLLPRIQITFEENDWSAFGVTPWMSYRVNLPIQPLPAVSARPEARTERLIVRPIQESDLKAFYELRQVQETQAHSTSRGRADRNLEETKENLAKLHSPHDEHHWYWGAFLASTGELIGEGGLPDTENQPTSGWTRFEILLKPAYWRQGFGTEFFNAIMDSFWELPRELRRHQLLPIVAGEKEPGQEVAECIEFVWEDHNEAAHKFFAKVLGQAPVSHEGYFTSFDWREGREGSLVRWGGTLAVNPKV